jgi:hypothetical protein
MVTMTIPLQDALNERSLALFIGADLPSGVTGVPPRAELANDLGKRYGIDRSLSLAEVTQRIGRAGNRFEFTNYLRTRLDLTGKSPAPFHMEIVAYVKQHKIKEIVTTAMDGLLELACQQAGLDINRLVTHSDTDFIRPGCPTMLKLCGDVEQPATLVITEKDYSSLLGQHNHTTLVDEVRHVFKHNTVLFIGFNPAAPDFRLLIDHVRESPAARLVYVTWHGLNPIDIRMWKDQGVVILESPPPFLNLPSLQLSK